MQRERGPLKYGKATSERNIDKHVKPNQKNNEAKPIAFTKKRVNDCVCMLLGKTVYFI